MFATPYMLTSIVVIGPLAVPVAQCGSLGAGTAGCVGSGVGATSPPVSVDTAYLSPDQIQTVREPPGQIVKPSMRGKFCGVLSDCHSGSGSPACARCVLC